MAEEIKYLVRIAGTDLDGKKPAKLALTRIRGVGPSLSQALVKTLGFDPDQQMGKFTDADVKKIEELLKDPQKGNIPIWMLNRQNDRETGKDGHLTSADLEFRRGKDIDRLKMIKARRGMRHAFGLKVRGQRTKNNGRKGKTLGVSRKKAMKKGKV